ncbi:MAG: LVIVD repeat-containing protein [Oceanicaulis sp.]
MTRFARLTCSAALAALCTGASFAQDEPAADPRQGLAPGLYDAGEAAKGMELVHFIPSPEGFNDPAAIMRRSMFEGDEPPAYSPLALANTDLAFADGKVFMGSYHGFNVYDTTSEGEPAHIASIVCPGGQGDVAVHGDLLFMSVEQNRGRLDCGTQGAEGEVNEERFRGIRIFDISDLSNPVQVGAVQTCRGSHTHTLVPHPSDENILYVYNQGTSAPRTGEELAGCSTGSPDENPETALYSIDIIKVELDNPAAAAIIDSPRIFADSQTGEIAGLWRGGRMGVRTQRTASTNHCHDITVYPEMGIAAGACSGNGILLDITDPENPVRLADTFDPDMAYWHAAIFNNEADAVVFTDEWGGGVGPMCHADSPEEWGANYIATIEDGEFVGQSLFKIPNVQTPEENCVAHNGSLVPVPGRDLFIQSWYQGGLSLIDFTDPANPFEVGFFDRGPVDAEELTVAGHWSAYWYNGRIYASEIARGLDVLRLSPTDQLSQAEIAAAEQVMTAVHNPQTQEKISWDDTAWVGLSYLDQLDRAEALESGLSQAARTLLNRWADGNLSNRSARRVAADIGEAASELEGLDAERAAALAALLTRAAS